MTGGLLEEVVEGLLGGFDAFIGGRTDVRTAAGAGFSEAGTKPRPTRAQGVLLLTAGGCRSH